MEDIYTLAIDASTRSTGIAIFKDKELIKYKCITKTSKNVFERIKDMTKEIEDIYLEYEPDQIVMEEVLPEDVRHNQSVYKALIYLQAAIVLMLDSYNKKVEFYTSSEWRAACGIHTGRGIKREELKLKDREFVLEKYNIHVNDDIADAIGIGYAKTNSEKPFNWE